MPLIPRQERFCQAFVHYGTATTAASEAGYAPRSAKKQGWRLLRSERIQARIREIQVALDNHHDDAEAAIIGKLEVVYRRALQDHQFYAAARAAQLQAQIMRERRRLAPAGPAPEMSTAGDDLRPVPQNPPQRFALAKPSAAAALRPVGPGG